MTVRLAHRRRTTHLRGMMRIVLSTTLVILILTACGCAPSGATVDDVDDDPTLISCGIGTSPSACIAADPEALRLAPWPDACGLWTRGDESALACAPADMAVWPSAATCADLIELAARRWPGGAVVRRLDGQLRALEAACP